MVSHMAPGDLAENVTDRYDSWIQELTPPRLPGILTNENGFPTRWAEKLHVNDSGLAARKSAVSDEEKSAALVLSEFCVPVKCQAERLNLLQPQSVFLEGTGRDVAASAVEQLTAVGRPILPVDPSRIKPDPDAEPGENSRKRPGAETPGNTAKRPRIRAQTLSVAAPTSVITIDDDEDEIEEIDDDKSGTTDNDRVFTPVNEENEEFNDSLQDTPGTSELGEVTSEEYSKKLRPRRDSRRRTGGRAEGTDAPITPLAQKFVNKCNDLSHAKDHNHNKNLRTWWKIQNPEYSVHKPLDSANPLRKVHEVMEAVMLDEKRNGSITLFDLRYGPLPGLDEALKKTDIGRRRLDKMHAFLKKKKTEDPGYDFVLVVFPDGKYPGDTHLLRRIVAPDAITSHSRTVEAVMDPGSALT